MFKYLKNYEINKFINHKQSYIKYWFKLIDSKINAVFGETVLLKDSDMTLERVYSVIVWQIYF